MIHKKLLSRFITGCLMLSSTSAFSQLFIDNATFTIQASAVITVQGDVTSNVDILGPGKLQLKGSANQNVNMNGFTIPWLEMDNAANATLTGNAKIGTDLLFTTGKILAGNFNLKFAATATNTGAAAGKFIETNGTGQVQKDVSSNLTGYSLPVGNGTFNPLQITTVGTYSSAVVGARDIAAAHPNKNARSSDYLNQYWSVTQTGITGTLDAKGLYTDPAGITGTEPPLNGIYWNGTAWSLAGSNIDNATNLAGATIAGNGDLYAMNKFVLSKVKVFLQGSYNSGTGFMNDLLRTSAAYAPPAYPVSNLIPTTTPYGVAPYTGQFVLVNNGTPETIASSVLNDQAVATDNIVDWVFVELRNNTTPGNAILGTRSALLKRDGNIVDVDGVSALYFKDVAAGAYNISVKHRNHMALATNPAGPFSTPLALTAPGAALDLTTLAATNLMGAANTAYFNNGTLNMLYAGNANSNVNVRFNGPSNDKDYLFITILGSLPLAVINNTYNAGDLNMNRNVRFNGPSNDKDYLFITVLGSLPLGIKTQSLPL
jgi:hypothetical protein